MRKSTVGSVQPLRRLWPFLGAYRLRLALAVLAMVSTALLSLALPLMVRGIVDGFSAISPQEVDRHFQAALLLAVLLAAATGLRYALVTTLGERVVADIRKAVFSKVIRLSPAYFEQTMTGEVISRLNTDTTLVQAVLDSTISMAVRYGLILAGGLSLMLWTSLRLSLLALIVVPLILLPLLALGRRLRSHSRTSQDRIADGAANASEALLAVQAVQANTHEDETRSAFGRLVELSLDAAYRRIRIRSLLTTLIISLAFSSVVLVIWTGASEVRGGQMSAGQLIQFVIFAIMVAGSAAGFSEVWGDILRAAGATERLIELLEADDPVSDPDECEEPAVPARGEVVFDRVGFRYPSRPTVAALEDVSFTIRQGETVALVGASGAGKSTVFQLMLRFFDPQSGTISIDGVDLRRMRRGNFRSMIALVPQETAVFAPPARDNIRSGRPGATDLEVEGAARAAFIHDFLAGLPDGYETVVGERGILLSGGQRQRLAIARAILRDARILLLDEATSSLDPESEAHVRSAVDRLAADRTTLIIAHRLATVQKADRILVFDRGRIVDEGTHSRLVAKGGIYERFSRLQLDGEDKTEGRAVAGQ